jgi:hypothetical protein
MAELADGAGGEAKSINMRKGLYCTNLDVFLTKPICTIGFQG